MSLFGMVRACAIALPVVFAGGAGIARSVTQNVVTIPPGILVVVAPGAADPVVEQMTALPIVPDQSGASDQPGALGHLVALDRLVAEQRAMMARMFADMDAMFGPASPVFNPLTIAAAPNGGAVVCEQSISITFGGGDAKPLVKVNHAGNGCGQISGAASSAGAPGAVPAETAPLLTPRERPRVLEINEAAPVRVPPVRHRT